MNYNTFNSCVYILLPLLISLISILVKLGKTSNGKKKTLGIPKVAFRSRVIILFSLVLFSPFLQILFQLY